MSIQLTYGSDLSPFLLGACIGVESKCSNAGVFAFLDHLSLGIIGADFGVGVLGRVYCALLLKLARLLGGSHDGRFGRAAAAAKLQIFAKGSGCSSSTARGSYHTIRKYRDRLVYHETHRLGGKARTKVVCNKRAKELSTNKSN
jgi:hypothetical protein